MVDSAITSTSPSTSTPSGPAVLIAIARNPNEVIWGRACQVDPSARMAIWPWDVMAMTSSPTVTESMISLGSISLDPSGLAGSVLAGAGRSIRTSAGEKSDSAPSTTTIASSLDSNTSIGVKPSSSGARYQPSPARPTQIRPNPSVKTTASPSGPTWSADVPGSVLVGASRTAGQSR